MRLGILVLLLSSGCCLPSPQPQPAPATASKAAPEDASGAFARTLRFEGARSILSGPFRPILNRFALVFAYLSPRRPEQPALSTWVLDRLGDWFERFRWAALIDSTGSLHWGTQRLCAILGLTQDTVARLDALERLQVALDETLEGLSLYRGDVELQSELLDLFD